MLNQPTLPFWRTASCCTYYHLSKLYKVLICPHRTHFIDICKPLYTIVSGYFTTNKLIPQLVYSHERSIQVPQLQGARLFSLIHLFPFPYFNIYFSTYYKPNQFLSCTLYFPADNLLFYYFSPRYAFTTYFSLSVLQIVIWHRLLY